MHSKQIHVQTLYLADCGKFSFIPIKPSKSYEKVKEKFFFEEKSRTGSDTDQSILIHELI